MQLLLYEPNHFRRITIERVEAYTIKYRWCSVLLFLFKSENLLLLSVLVFVYAIVNVYLPV